MKPRPLKKEDDCLISVPSLDKAGRIEYLDRDCIDTERVLGMIDWLKKEMTLMKSQGWIVQSTEPILEKIEEAVKGIR